MTEDKRLIEWLGENNDIGQDIWRHKYQYNNETFDEWLDRVSGGDSDIREEIEAKRFLFGGRILANRGLYKDGIKVTYSNCYVLPPPEDNIESIYDTAKELARTFSYGGGVGIDISNLAPRGARVHNTAKETSGAVSFMDLYSATTGLIGQNGRRGALMISIDCNHPDLEEFIEIKSDLDKVTTANISIRMDDEFMSAVEKDQDIELRFVRPETDEEVVKRVNARNMFKKIAFQNWDMGEPGILFWDRIRSWNLLSEDKSFEYAGTNPCLTGDTIIAVADGRNGVPIKDLCNTTFPVYSARLPRNGGGNRKTAKGDNWVAEVKGAKAFKSGTKRVVTVKLSDGSEFRCTPDHRLALADGTYLEAEECKGKQLAKFFTFSNKNNAKSYRHINSITSNRQYRYIADYYNILEPNETIHHIDGDSTNDNPNNLASIAFKDHMAEMGDARKRDNPITRDINYKFNQGLRNITANGNRYGWSKEKIQSEKQKYINTHQHLYTEKVDENCYLNDIVYVVDIIDNNDIEDVYDITVEDNHNFYIINNTDDERYLNCSGVLVHNCAEEPLPAYGSCLLGSINLSEFVNRPYTDTSEFDYGKLERTTYRAVKALNDVLDEGLPLHPLKGQRETVRDWRQIGLGVFGIADMLIKMGIEYGSVESFKLFDKIGSMIAKSAIMESNKMAREFGAYPNYNDKVIQSKYMRNLFAKSELETINLHGLRNSQLLTIAPTGTLSTMLQVSGGIEPYFATSWQRTTKSLHGEDVTYIEHPKAITELMDVMGIDEDGELPSYVVTSSTISPTNRIRTQATWQKYIDASISSTINLPKDTSVEDVANIYMEAWKEGLKGVTIFRDGCRRVGILTTSPDDDKMDNISFGRGDIMNVTDDIVGYKRKIVNGCGDFQEQIFFDDFTGEPVENYIAMGDGGGCERNAEAISRLISLCWRGGIDVSEVVAQLKKVRTCPAYRTRTLLKGDTSKGTSCPSAIGFAIEELNDKINERVFADEGEEIENDTLDDENNTLNIKNSTLDNTLENKSYPCPECGEELTFEGGCNICKSCGWSKCD